MSSFRIGAALGAVLVFVAALAGASPWPELPTDLSWDPAWTRGALPNGFRYAVRKNEQPKGRVSLRLLIACGSLHEELQERGVAHFIEHLAFRGTKAFPNGSMGPLLQRKGIGLGPENTAFTGYESTIYHLELPNADDATLRLGLQVFREYASAISFDPAAIEMERGVVLAEKATRNVAEYRRNEQNLAFLWPDSRYALRPVIGDELVIRSVTREELVHFYDTWYRPERMALIAVGDVDPARIVALANELFSPLQPRADAHDDPADVVPEKASAPDVLVYCDPGISGVELAFEHPRRRLRVSNNRPERVEYLQRALAFEMLQRRLNRRSVDSGYSLVAPGVDVARMVRDWETALFTANGQIDTWAHLANLVEQEHRRAFRHGFTAEELDRAREAFKERYDTYVRTAPSRHSESLAAEMAGVLLSGDVLVTPEAMRDDMAEALARATPQECTKAFRRVWETGPLHVIVAANPAFRVTAKEFADVLNASRLVQVDAPAGVGPSTFLYTDFGPPGKLVHDKVEKDLDVRLTAFENGVRLNFKKTTFEADIVDALVRVGTGKLSQPTDKPGLDLLAQYGFLNGGLGKHRVSDLRDLFAGKSIYLRFFVFPDAFEFQLRATRKDFDLGMRLLAAHLADPGFREDTIRDANTSYSSAVTAAVNVPSGVIQLSAMSVLLGRDERWAFPGPNEFQRRTTAELRAWLEPQLKTGPIELSVVGDIDWEEASSVVARTLGALPNRQPRPAVTPAMLPKFVPVPAAPIRFPIGAQFKQVALAWYWPVTVDLTVWQERRWNLLAACFQERLWKRLREELGATYGPSVSFTMAPGVRGMAYLMAAVDVDTARASDAAAIIRREIELLSKEGVTDDEFERTKQPYLRRREDDLRSNAYWGGTVLSDAQQNPDRLTAARDRQKDTAAIKRSEIRSLFRKFVSVQKGFLFISEPGGQVLIFGGK